VESLDAFDETLASARAGGEHAWERIYRWLAPSLTGYLRGQGAAEPDDLAGEVFVHVVRDLAGFEGGERDFRAWVFTIAHRRLTDERRRSGRRPAVTVDPARVAVLAGAGGDVGEEAHARLGDARVRQALGELPADQRAVLLLRIVGDLTVAEIARVLGRREGAIKALQRRGLKNLEQGAYPFGPSER
jgi:RNA polymerase sigma-70 factor (ECF subfamily)